MWIKKLNKGSFELVTTHDQAEEFAKHIKKFGAFSKMKLEEIGSVFPTIHGIQTEFSSNETDIYTWQIEAIKSGQAWISKTTEHLFQPQELRLHQRDGVHFDKGCYLGQEIVARLWFKAKPKHWLHLIHAKGDLPAPATQLNNLVEGWVFNAAFSYNKRFTENGRRSLAIEPVIRYGTGNSRLNGYLRTSYSYGKKYANNVGFSIGSRVFQFNNANPILPRINTYYTLLENQKILAYLNRGRVS